MSRKPIGLVTQKVNTNLDDTETVITLMLKRMCTFDGAVDYLLSRISGPDKDDMLGELVAWDAMTRKTKRME